MTTGWTHITANGLFPGPRLAGVDDMSAPHPAQVETCRRWLRACAMPTKTTRRRVSSYAYKHRVEDWCRAVKVEQVDPWGRRWVGGQYIANGAFIEAARLEGYHVSRAGEGSPNAVFNLCLRTPRAG